MLTLLWNRSFYLSLASRLSKFNRKLYKTNLIESYIIIRSTFSRCATGVDRSRGTRACMSSLTISYPVWVFVLYSTNYIYLFVARKLFVDFFLWIILIWYWIVILKTYSNQMCNKRFSILGFQFQLCFKLIYTWYQMHNQIETRIRFLILKFDYSNLSNV